MKPEVILLDEPCSALDPISTAKIEELIDELKDDYTIAIVTHNMQQAARVSDFTAFMYLGETGRVRHHQQDVHHARRTGGRRTTSPAASAERVRPARARGDEDGDANDMTAHTIKAFDVDLQELARMIAEMGGLAEQQIGDCDRRAQPPRRGAGAERHRRRRQDRRPAARDRGEGDPHHRAAPADGGRSARDRRRAARLQRPRADRRPRQEHRQARDGRSTASSTCRR